MNEQTPPADPQPTASNTPETGTKDGKGAGDIDRPFHGFRDYHFTTREMVRLLVLRGRVLDGRQGLGSFGHDLAA